MTRQLSIVCAIAFLLFGFTTTQAQTWPAFTIAERTTHYDVEGDAIEVSTATRYDSASGDWRWVQKVGGQDFATVYRRGKGVYQSSSRSGRLVRVSNHAPGCPSTTATQLLSDIAFVRTETVMGFEAYVLSERFPSANHVIETYFVPELGRIPFKRNYIFDNGHRWVTEPISIELGEPAEADLYGPDYPVIEQIPVFNKELAREVLSKPEPTNQWGAHEHGGSGKVIVSVIVDESGSVVTALMITQEPRLSEAALDAAYRTSFAPTIRDGRPVVARGTLAYNFGSPTHGN